VRATYDTRTSLLSGSAAGVDDEKGSDMPMASMAEPMVLAVYLREARWVGWE